jgi:hypothetical protein
VSFLNAHPEIARNPAFYVGEGFGPRFNRDPTMQGVDLWRDVLTGLAVFAGFGMAIGLLVWLIRTLTDYRRWSRLAKVQTDVHTKLLDRFTANEDLLAYIQSPAGAKFLQSSPITLDAAPRSVGAPLGRILWSVQGGVVLSRLATTPCSGRSRHCARSGVRDIGDNLVCDLAAARADRTGISYASDRAARRLGNLAIRKSDALSYVS